VSYSNSSESPNTASRTVSYVINDGALNATAVTSTITVTAVNDAPVLSDTALSFTTLAEDAAAPSGAVGALVSITVGTLYQKRFVQPCDVRTANTVQLLAALVVTLPLALLESESMRWNSELVGAMAWSVLGLTLGGSSLLYLLIQRGAAASVTSLMYLVPPTTAMMAWWLFGETITAATVLGTVLTAVGVSLVVRPSRP
jgi:drug/metabolite transporter (DMT)-like permease